MARWTGADEVAAVIAAGSAWRERCFAGDGSILSGRALWTETNLADLVHRFTESPIQGNDSTFAEKLRQQINGAPPEVQQLAAEAVWFVQLFPHMSGMQPATKRQRVQEIWSWSGERAPPEPTFLADDVLSGVGGVGIYYQTGIPNEFGFLLEVALAWKRRPATDRELGEGEAAAWRFAEWLDSRPGADKRPIRHAILYFCFPDYFERNVSANQRTDIYLALRGKLPEAERQGDAIPVGAALDRALFVIRSRLATPVGTEEIDFYRPPLRGMWEVDARDERRKSAAAVLEGVLDNYNLELHQTGSKKRRLRDTRPVDESVGFWRHPNDATNKPLRWIVHIDLTLPEPVATLPQAHGAGRVAFLNSAKGRSGGVLVRIVPAMRLKEGLYEFFETWEWLLMLCFLPALDAGSAAQLLENYDPATGALSYLGRPQPYVAAGLIALNDPGDIYIGETRAGPREITYRDATAALRALLSVSPSVDLQGPEAANG